MPNAIAGKYSAVLRSRGGLRQVLRRYGPLRVLDAGLREAWESLGMRILHWLGRRPGKPYGWLEAVFSPAWDVWQRYTVVVQALAGAGLGKPRRLVEVSSGGRGGIAWPLRGTDFEVCLVDWSAELLGDWRGGKAWRVCADACRLPFADNSFDAAVSLDTVEHLSQNLRAPFLEELQRVARQSVVLTCPLQSADGEFRAQEFDLKLRQRIEAKGQPQPMWLEEHLQRGHPTKEALVSLLPGSEVKGTENCAVWLRLASFYQKALVWPLAGLYYLAALRKRDVCPPYRRGLIVWRKPVMDREFPADVCTDLAEAVVSLPSED